MVYYYVSLKTNSPEHCQSLCLKIIKVATKKISRDRNADLRPVYNPWVDMREELCLHKYKMKIENTIIIFNFTLLKTKWSKNICTDVF